MKRVLLFVCVFLFANVACAQDCSNGMCNGPVANTVKAVARGAWLPIVQTEKVVAKEVTVEKKTTTTKKNRVRLFRRFR